MTAATPNTEELLRHAGWVRALAHRLVADDHAADDLAQDAMLAALRRPPSADVRGWFAAVLHNAVRSRRRRHVRRAQREAVAARPEPQPATVDLLARLSVHRALAEEVQALAEPYRTAILLRYFEELSLRDVAERCGVPVPTVNSRLRRAVEQLRERMDRRCGDRRTWAAALLALPGARATAALPIAAAAAVVLGGGALVFALTQLWPTGERDQASRAPRDREVARTATEGPTSPRDLDARAMSRVPVARDDPATAGPGIDGVVIDTNGTPVPNVLVALVPSDVADTFPSADADRPAAQRDASELLRRAIVTTRTAADGNFALGPDQRDGRLFVIDDLWATVLAGISWQQVDAQRVVIVAPTTSLTCRVSDASGAPVVGAEVEVHLPESFRGRFAMPLDYSVAVGWRATTDPRGATALAVPRVRDTELGVTALGFAPLRVVWDPFAQPHVELQLEPAVAAGDAAISGTVVDEQGRPLAGAWIADGRGQVTRSDADGRFRLRREPGATTTCVAVAAGRLPVRQQIDSDDVVLRLAEPSLEIVGRVVDPIGQPVSNAWVWVTDPTLLAHDDDHTVVIEAITAGQTSSWHIVTTDYAGRFRLDGLDRRTYHLRAGRAGSSVFGERADVVAGATDVVVVHPTDAVLPRLRGTVRDETGQVVAGANVVASRHAMTLESSTGGGFSWWANGPATTTAADGTFCLYHVPEQANLLVNGQDLIYRTVAAGEWQTDGDLEIVISRRCYLQADVAANDRRHLTFSVRDAGDHELDVLLSFGIGKKPQPRVDLLEGRSPVVAIPTNARWVVLHDGEAEVSRQAITPVPREVTRVRF